MNSLYNIARGGDQLPWQRPDFQEQQPQGGGFFDRLSTYGPQIAAAYPILDYMGNANQYQKPAQNIANAMVDMNNPLYQQMYGQFKQQGQANLAQTIAQLSGQNRKLAMAGRTPLFDAERGGEQLFRGLTQGYGDVQNAASQQAFKQLENAYAPAMQMGANRQQNAKTQAIGTGGLIGTIASLLGF